MGRGGGGVRAEFDTEHVNVFINICVFGKYCSGTHSLTRRRSTKKVNFQYFDEPNFNRKYQNRSVRRHFTKFSSHHLIIKQ